MTDAELQGIALQALNLAKKDLRAGKLNWVLASYHHGEGLRRMARIEELLIEKFGPDWLNSNAKKDAVFSGIKAILQLVPPDAIVMVTAANAFTPTEAFHRLKPKEQRTLLDSSHDRHHQAVKDGLLAMSDVMQSLAQTPSRVCIYIQATAAEEPASVKFFDQKEFSGRLKLYP